MAQTAVGTCTITRLRTGDSIYITFNVNGSTCIFYDDNGLVTKYSANNLVVIPNITSQKGLAVTINSVSWSVNGSALSATYGTSVATTGVLTINKDFADKSNSKSYVFTMAANITVNGYTQTVNKSFEITMAKVASNSYWGTAKTNRSQLSNSNYSATLTKELSLGGKTVSQGGSYGVADDSSKGKYQVRWFKNGTLITQLYGDKDSNGNEPTSMTAIGNNPTSIKIGRKDVDGAAFFSCKFYVDGSTEEVEADGLTIIDLDDELKVICPDEVQVAYGETASITPSLYNTASKSAITSGITWSVLVKCNYTNYTIPSSQYTFNTSTGAFTMEEDDMVYNSSAANLLQDSVYGKGISNKTEYSPIIIFTATI